jgi:hypothetical protein
MLGFTGSIRPKRFVTVKSEASDTQLFCNMAEPALADITNASRSQHAQHAHRAQHVHRHEYVGRWEETRSNPRKDRGSLING